MKPYTNPSSPAAKLRGWTLALAASAAAVVGMGLFAGCGDGSGGGGRSNQDVSDRQPNPDAEAEFVFANRGEVSQLDPNQMSWMQDIRVGNALFEGVYSLDPQTLTPILGSGESVEHNDDYTEWTIRLRDNAGWSNGDDLTANDFIFAWRRNMREPGDYSYLVNEYIKGAKAYAERYASDPSGADSDLWPNVGIEKIDNKTLKVTLNNTLLYFPDLLTFVTYWPMNEKAMESFKETAGDGKITYDASWTQPGNLVSNGAYYLERWDLKQGQTLRMNEHYWDKENVRSKTIRSLDLPNPELAFERYENGTIDWVTDLPGQFAYDMSQAGRSDLIKFPAYGTYFWTFNTNATRTDGSPNPLADVRVRQALTAAIDKEQIVNTITKMDEMPTSVYVPKNAEYFKGYKHPEGIGYSVDEAKKLLADAGYPDGKGFPRLKLLFNSETGNHKDIAQNLARQWREKLGIDFDLDPVEMAQFKDRYSPEVRTRDDGSQYLEPGDFDIARGSWYGDYMDVTTFTDKYKPLSKNNDAVWVNAEYDALCKQAETETDAQKRLDLLAQAEQILVKELPILPIYHYTQTYIKAPYIKGLFENPRVTVLMKYVETPRSTGPGVGKGYPEPGESMAGNDE